MAGQAPTQADLEKLRRDLETRIGRVEQAAQRPAAADPATTRSLAAVNRAIEQLVVKIAALERKVEANGGNKADTSAPQIRELTRNVDQLTTNLARVTTQVERLGSGRH